MSAKVDGDGACVLDQPCSADTMDKHTIFSEYNTTSRRIFSSDKATTDVQETTREVMLANRTIEGVAACITGWGAITLLVGFYLLALVVAISHALMMHYLDGKPTDDRRYLYLGQAYVTSVNILLVAGFKASLCASLTIAFTQHMWRILRTTPLSISVIESLHGVRSNPALLAVWQIGCATPMLYMMALLMWLFAVAILFPPSALTVVRHDYVKEQILQVVPTFDPAYGKQIDARPLYITRWDEPTIGNSSLSTWHIASEQQNETVIWMSYEGPNAKLSHLSHVVLASGNVPESRSPCGTNCAYTVEFEGPIFNCSTAIRNETKYHTNGDNSPYYSGTWETRINPASLSPSFNSDLIRFIGVYDRWLLQEVRTLRCQPSWTRYKIDMQYRNGIRTFSYDTTASTSLQDTFSRNVYPGQPNYTPGSKETINTTIDWSDEAIGNLKTINNYAILDTIVSLLSGTFNQIPIPVAGSEFTSPVPNGTEVQWNTVEAGPSFWSKVTSNVDGNDHTWVFGSSSEIQQQTTMIKDTRFNVNLDSWADTRPLFNVTEKLLNEMVANVTIATMLTYYAHSVVNETVLANMTSSQNMYSFSRPRNLILPYTLSLVLSLPFLLVGYIAHRRNGVPALSDSFIQLLVTMARSRDLDRVVTSSLSDGDQLATKRLKQTKIMFGEVADPDGDGMVRRMGFGLEHEIIRVGK